MNTDIGDLYGQFCVLGMSPFNNKVGGLSWLAGQGAGALQQQPAAMLLPTIHHQTCNPHPFLCSDHV